MHPMICAHGFDDPMICLACAADRAERDQPIVYADSVAGIQLAKPQRHHHRWTFAGGFAVCRYRKCGLVLEGGSEAYLAAVAASRLGRRSRAKGARAERRLEAVGLGRRRGQVNGPVDNGDIGEALAGQSKAGPSYWPKRMAGWLDAMAGAAAGRPRYAAMVETPGPGRRARILIIQYLDEWAATPEEARLAIAEKLRG